MTEEEKEELDNLIYTLHIHHIDTSILFKMKDTIQKQQEEIEKKDKLEKEVADDIDKVAVELDKLSDNIYIVNQAMLLQKIAQKKLGKFYID